MANPQAVAPGPLRVQLFGGLYVGTTDSADDARAMGRIYDPDDGSVSPPLSLGGIVAHLGGNGEWEDVADAEVPEALRAAFATELIETPPAPRDPP